MRSLFVAIWVASTATLSAAAAQTAVTPSQPSSAIRSQPPNVTPPAAKVLTGNYKTLGFWQKVKLGSAYYVNPQAVRDAHVVYSYDSKEFVAAGKSPEIWTLAKDGKVTFGVPDAQASSIKAVPISALQDEYKVENQADLTKLLASDTVKVIATKDSLLGKSATQALVRSEAQ
jgi:hypothetical protein